MSKAFSAAVQLIHNVVMGNRRFGLRSVQKSFTHLHVYISYGRQMHILHYGQCR